MVIFVQQARLLGFEFFIQLSLKTARMPWDFLLAVVFATSTSGRFESLPATKNHPGIGDSKDESDPKTVSVPDSETGQQSSHHIQLELMGRQPQQGNADKVFVENNFDTTSVTWRSKFSAVLLQLLCASVQLKLFSMTQT